MHYENAKEAVQAGLCQLLIQHHRCQLHGGNRPMAKKLWERRLHRNFVSSSVWNN